MTGIEPVTSALPERCSASELHQHGGRGRRGQPTTGPEAGRQLAACWASGALMSSWELCVPLWVETRRKGSTRGGIAHKFDRTTQLIGLHGKLASAGDVPQRRPLAGEAWATRGCMRGAFHDVDLEVKGIPSGDQTRACAQSRAHGYRTISKIQAAPRAVKAIFSRICLAAGDSGGYDRWLLVLLSCRP